jgi:hypothetical protein
MTQAVNLANFANNLDSSGGVAPSALNAAVSVAKGGTGSTTASAARTALGVDYVTIGQLMYPVGSIYINAGVTTNPATLLGFGTWVAFGAGRVAVGLNASDPLFDALEETGGSKDAIVVSHSHTATSTVTDPGHNHTVALGSSFAGNVFVQPTVNSISLSVNTGTATTGITVGTTVASTGTTATNANVQPYITVAMWKRTA